MNQSVSHITAYTITCIALICSLGSIVVAQSYNWIPLGSVGAAWSANGAHTYHSKAGGVVIGGILPDGALLLDVAGPVGASQFCDAAGNNCMTTTQVNWSVPDGSGHIHNTNSGRVGINTPTPTQQLHVGGNVLANSFLYTSDRNLKHNIQNIEGLEVVRQLRGVSFNWNHDGSSAIGLVAQEVEQVLPELVVTDKVSGMKSVQYANVVAVLIEAIKEQQQQIEDLRAHLNSIQ